MISWEAFMEHAEEVRLSYWAEAYEWLAAFDKKNNKE